MKPSFKLGAAMDTAMAAGTAIAVITTDGTGVEATGDIGTEAIGY